MWRSRANVVDFGVVRRKLSSAASNLAKRAGNLFSRGGSCRATRRLAMTTSASNSVWDRHAQQWNRVGYPLRPSARDGELMMELVKPALEQNGDPARVAILGVTREVVALPWPAGTTLLAFDQNAEMIAKVWQPAVHLHSTAIQATWRRLPLPDHSLRLIVGDGSFTCLAGLSDLSRVMAELARVLEPEGIVCVRCFLRPDVAETLDELYANTCAGKIAGFHALKLSIGMSLARPPEFRVPVVDILQAFERMFSDRRALAMMTDWPVESIDTIDAYRGADVSYNFPTLAAFQSTIAPWFDFDHIAYVDADVAKRCPTMRLRIAPRWK